MPSYDTMSIGATPYGEQCESVGDNYRPAVARKECQIFARQLTRLHGDPPTGATYTITSNPHDFGTYHEVAVRYDINNEEAVEYALKVENDSPEHWDETAKKELAAFMATVNA